MSAPIRIAIISRNESDYAFVNFNFLGAIDYYDNLSVAMDIKEDKEIA